MPLDVADCVDSSGSTDCLLRILVDIQQKGKLENDKELDWDPITFGFTVAIALCAATFAWVTVLQAVLAAGPGRRRCDKKALGRWSSLSIWEWSWWNLCFVHKVWTPVLNWKTLKLICFAESEDKEKLRYSRHSVSWGFSWWMMIRDVPRNLFRKIQNIPGKIRSLDFKDRKPAASWVQCLDMLLKDKIGPDSIFPGSRMERSCKTADYLPNDIIAVPADAQVGFLIIVLTIAGGSWARFDMQTPLPTILGDRFQFEFRSHPTMGTVGVFLTHGLSAEKLKENSVLSTDNDYLRNLQVAMYTCFGNLPLHPALTHPYPYQRKNVHWELPVAVPASIDQAQQKHTGACQSRVRSCKAAPSFGYLEFRPLSDFLFSDSKVSSIHLFAKVEKDIISDFKALLAQSKYLGSGGLAWLSRETHPFSCLLGGPVECDSCERSGTSCDCRQIFKQCILFVEDQVSFQTWFNTLGSFRGSLWRGRLQNILETVQDWQFQDASWVCHAITLQRSASVLRQLQACFPNTNITNYGRLVYSALKQACPSITETPEGAVQPPAREIFYDSPELQQLTDSITGSCTYSNFCELLQELKRCETEDRRDYNEESAFPYFREGKLRETRKYCPSSDQRLVDVMIVRTIMVAVLCWTAWDTTELIDSKMWDQMVPIL